MEKRDLSVQARAQIMAPPKKEPHYSFGDAGGAFIAAVVMLGALSAAWLAGGFVSGIANGGGSLILGGGIMLALALASLVACLVFEWQAYKTYQAEKKVYEKENSLFSSTSPGFNAEIDLSLDEPEDPLLKQAIDAQKKEQSIQPPVGGLLHDNAHLPNKLR